MTRRPLGLLAFAIVTAAAAVAVWLVAFAVPGGRSRDAAAMESFARVAQPPFEPSIHGVAVLADPVPFAVGTIVMVVIALLRRRWLMAAVVPVILVGANALTQLLKPALADPRIIELYGTDRPYPASWPSGHSTASMSLALCLVLVVGPRLRPPAALAGAAYAVGIGYALSRSAGISRATSSAAISSRRRSRCSAPPRSRHSRRARRSRAPSASARRRCSRCPRSRCSRSSRSSSQHL